MSIFTCLVGACWWTEHCESVPVQYVEDLLFAGLVIWTMVTGLCSGDRVAMWGH